ncbi:MAG: hypothetical protein K0R65_1307 [Crocinitomicaceae bacterium]|nr:hypothetical protein [Crocinitomicaceae bacterium]
MNIEEYIASGILESYVLGQTSAQENALIECLVKTNPAVAEEVRLIRLTFEQLAESSKIQPPTELKSQIWAQLRQEEVQAAPSKEETPQPEAKIVSLEERREPKNGSWLRVAASVTVIAVSSAFAVYFFVENKRMNERLAQLESNSEQLEKSNKTQQDYLAFLADKETNKIMLAGVPDKPDAKATVFWNPKNKHVMLSDARLPKAPENMQYQLWAIVDGKPVDAGMLDVDHEGKLLEMKTIGNSQAFAITLEPMGGSPEPHLEDLCVIGNVR